MEHLECVATAYRPYHPKVETSGAGAIPHADILPHTVSLLRPSSHLISPFPAVLIRVNPSGSAPRQHRALLVTPGDKPAALLSGVVIFSDGTPPKCHRVPLAHHIPMQTASIASPIADSRSLVVSRHREGRG